MAETIQCMNDDAVLALVKMLYHRTLVAAYIQRIIGALTERATTHDLSKLSDDEFPGFVKVNGIARNHRYGSEKYNASTKTGVVRQHLARNPHHPEYYEGGLDDMTFIDLVEMAADWKAATETYGLMSMEEALEISRKRFGLKEKHMYLIRLVLDAMDGFAPRGKTL